MPYIITQIPDPSLKKIRVTFENLLPYCPMVIPYLDYFWLGERLARDGVQTLSGIGTITEGLTFITDTDDTPSNEMMQYFDSLVAPLGIHATVRNNWRDMSQWRVPLYANGQRMVNDQGVYLRLPPPAPKKQEITWEYIDSKLPELWPFPHTAWATGSLPKLGESFKDFDVFISPGPPWTELTPNSELVAIKQFLTPILRCRVDVGCIPMPAREPIAMYKIYEGGKRCR